jgi:ATP-dependent helicase/nuclease subunit B
VISTAPSAAYQTLFGGEGPRWFTIAAHRPFLDDLAAGLNAALAPLGPEALADAVVLTPTRRAARELAESFLRVGDAPAVLLPQIRALGELDEGEPPFEPGDLSLDLAPAISPMRRRFELARLVADHADLLGRELGAAGALELGDALGAFLESMQIAEIADPSAVYTLVEGELARHWEISARFLALAVEVWPRRLKQLGLIDVTDRRTQLLRALAEQWARTPPQRPLIAAGSTGTAPATAALLSVVASAPKGCVVLPGLDLDLAETAWAEVADAHPQDALRRLLARSGVARDEVKVWPARESLADQAKGRRRRRVVNEALRPAEATADWLRVIGDLRQEGAGSGRDPIAQGLEGLSVVAARTEEETAAAAAVLLRETLETPDLTAGLITPDAALARRVSAKLARWGVRIDSSAGSPLGGHPAGVLIGLTAASVADPLAPPTLLAILKHPRVRLGLEDGALAQALQTLERRGLRGARPRTWADIFGRLARYPDVADATALAQSLQAALALAAEPFADGLADVGEAARALTEAMERLGCDPHGRSRDLWAGADGEAASGFLAEMIEHGAALPPCSARGFSQLVAALMATETLRSGGASHPRLKILGALEARLIRADRLILAGLEEGVWPRPAEVDPFLSRPMRAKMGLPPPERRVGLSAHDFAQAACAPEVVLIHSERRGGQPAVMSRWLWRLETLARGAGLALPRRDDALTWARALDAPLADPPQSLTPASRPAPRPPVEVRPTELPVTEVERWVRDPYAVYARRILGLRRLDRPDERIEARARGAAIHKALEIFAEEWTKIEPPDAPARFADLYIQALHDQGLPDGAMARERILAVRSGAWIAELEARRRGACRRVLVEQAGALTYAMADGSSFRLTARADRLELFEGGVHVLDFKTGRAPTAKEIETGFAPQLTLTAALLMGGGFEDLGPIAPGELVYLRLTGRTPPGDEIVRAGLGESEALGQVALDGLMSLVARYRRPAQPYRSRTATRFLSQVSDYDHLARVREWSAAADDEDEG